MVSFQPIEPRRIYMRIVDQIRAMIESGDLRTGQRWPSERALAEQFKVSRPSVREALSALEILGLVDSQHGDGTYVREAAPGERLTLATLDDISPMELLRAREAIECSIVRMAAREADARDLAALREAVREMKAAFKRGEYSMEADREFHVRIARATHNTLLLDVGEHAANLMRQRLWHAITARNLQRPGRAAKYIREHRRIYRAIARHNEEAAFQEMRGHLQGVIQDLFEEDETP